MLLKIVNWFYKWLPIIFGCHCLDDRSFYWNGKKFPICARCTGILIGSLTAFITYILACCPISVCTFLIIPLVADGFRQQFTDYESTNIRRLVTGLFFGFGLVRIVLHTILVLPNR
ncbi:DUF2085 domain-containing protein [Pseudoflavonifractor phocaeensis]|uniref:DUF2085 domain-containing protein n=1 Tax=Pseudoflavonifractor phocaeensis TaxID=1870988 RepID=UPI00195991E8|nr:DUF2085 domain-containing protein [Pseudoflavonifractor phocaeensis]MBM6723279.1 DUF2085 domain-containing protein [Pseudoflavonifractor phocaeensis]